MPPPQPCSSVNPFSTRPFLFSSIFFLLSMDFHGLGLLSLFVSSIFFFFSVILLYFRLGSICVAVACQQRRTRRIVTSECWRVMERREARICLIFENLQLPQKIGQDWGPEWFVMTGRRRRAEKERFTDDEWVICRAPLRIIFGHTGVEKKKKKRWPNPSRKPPALMVSGCVQT